MGSHQFCREWVRGRASRRIKSTDWLNAAKSFAREVRGRKKGKLHTGAHDWRALVDHGLAAPLPSETEERQLEERARHEKAAALEQLFCSRLSVLIGPASTGKTTLLRMLCALPDVDAKGVLLLAPTGKARVRLEEQTAQRGAGRTLAQIP